MGQWVGQWMGLDQITKNGINLELIEIIQFCLKIYDWLRCSHQWVGVWVVEWMSGLICGSMGGVRSYHCSQYEFISFLTCCLV